MNIVDTIKAEIPGYLEKAAVIDGDRQVTYAELLALVDGVASELKSRGVGPAQRVALICDDSIEYIVVSLAVLSLPAALVPVSPSHSQDEVGAVLREIDAAFLIFDEKVFSLDPAEPLLLGGACKRTFLLHRRATQDDLPVEYGAMNPAFIRFSSGTTGASKGVVLSHETVVERTDAADKALNMTEDDTVIWVLSMSYHFVVSILLFLRRGAKIVLCRRELLSSLVDGLGRRRGTFIYASPFHYQLMTSAAAFSAGMLANVRLAVSTATRLPEADARRFYEKFGIELAEAYGIIEVGLPFINCSRNPAKRGSVGRILPDYEVKIANPDTEGVGEVYLRGSGMFDAYFSPWQSRKQALSDGWCKTGDLGRIDSGGFLFLCGRAKNIINFAGMKIFPKEVESVVNQHPAVRESLVYGTAHAQYGELPCADIPVLLSTPGTVQGPEGIPVCASPGEDGKRQAEEMGARSERVEEELEESCQTDQELARVERIVGFCGVEIRDVMKPVLDVEGVHGAQPVEDAGAALVVSIVL
jgi:long-chain acyl-CoA synthetase